MKCIFCVVKLWEKGIKTDKLVEEFTVGNDSQLDLLLAPYDILGSIAHAIMLYQAGLISDEEILEIKRELVRLYYEAEKGNFTI